MLGRKAEPEEREKTPFLRQIIEEKMMGAASAQNVRYTDPDKKIVANCQKIYENSYMTNKGTEP